MARKDKNESRQKNEDYVSKGDDYASKGDDYASVSRETWFWVFVIVIIGFLGGVIAIIAVAIADVNNNLPDQIDAVIYDKGRGRYKAQIKAVQKYMGFINHIYVLSTSSLDENVGDGSIPVSFKVVSGATTQELAFEEISQWDVIGENVMFLSDRTFPCYKIYKTYLFYSDRPRLFNVMQDQAEVNFFKDTADKDNPLNYWEDTIVTMVGKKEYMGNHNNVQEYLFDEITREQVVLRNDMNRNIFVNSANAASSATQFKNLESQRPLFATFHISGSDTGSANTTLVEWLNTTKLFQ